MKIVFTRQNGALQTRGLLLVWVMMDALCWAMCLNKSNSRFLTLVDLGSKIFLLLYSYVVSTKNLHFDYKTEICAFSLWYQDFVSGVNFLIRKFVFQMSGGHKKARPKGPVVQNPNSFRMERPPDGPPVELENQFILRLPQVNIEYLCQISLKILDLLSSWRISSFSGSHRSAHPND